MYLNFPTWNGGRSLYFIRCGAHGAVGCVWPPTEHLPLVCDSTCVVCGPCISNLSVRLPRDSARRGRGGGGGFRGARVTMLPARALQIWHAPRRPPLSPFARAFRKGQAELERRAASDEGSPHESSDNTPTCHRRKWSTSCGSWAPGGCCASRSGVSHVSTQLQATGTARRRLAARRNVLPPRGPALRMASLRC